MCSRFCLHEALSWNHDYRKYHGVETVKFMKNNWSHQNVCVSPEGEEVTEERNWGSAASRWVGGNLQEILQQPFWIPQENSHETLVEFLAVSVFCKSLTDIWGTLLDFVGSTPKKTWTMCINISNYKNLQIFRIFVLVENFSSWVHTSVQILVSFGK